MLIAGVCASVAGLFLFLGALAWILRTNPTTRIPFFTNAAVVPPGSTLMRALGAGFLVFGAVGLSTSGTWWTVLIAVLGPGAALLLIAVHNKRSHIVEDSRERA